MPRAAQASSHPAPGAARRALLPRVIAAAACLATPGAPVAVAQTYQIVTVPGTQSVQPGVYLLNTSTGQSWSLARETNEWTPLKYWIGPGRQSSVPPPLEGAAAK